MKRDAVVLLELAGTKIGCAADDCGACGGLLDGVAVNSCVLMHKKVIGKRVMNIEGVAPEGGLYPI